MATLIILGSSHAIPAMGHENTHMVMVDESATVLVDCPGNPVIRLQQAGVEVNSVTHLFLTHFHPDHVSGAPLLLMSMWLLGRRHPLEVYGLGYTLDRMESMMNLYGWNDWPSFFPVIFHRLPEDEMTLALDSERMRIYTSSVKHLIPAIGLRFEMKHSRKAFAYSCDTEPCQAVVRLAQGAEVLIHEAAGDLTGHSSAEQAAEIARQAGVVHLYLIHYPPGPFEPSDLIERAKNHFSGPVTLAEDWLRLNFD